MKPPNMLNTSPDDIATCPEAKKVIVTLSGDHRWEMYHRLKELDISCHCSAHQPVTVEVDTVTTALQVWSMQKRFSYSRQDAIAALQNAWHQPSPRRKK